MGQKEKDEKRGHRRENEREEKGNREIEKIKALQTLHYTLPLLGSITQSTDG